jgi:signal transduction histidine kinase
MSHDIVVQEHQGTISVDAEVGQYAEFIITLPKQALSLSEAPGPPPAR